MFLDDECYKKKKFRVKKEWEHQVERDHDF